MQLAPRQPGYSAPWLHEAMIASQALEHSPSSHLPLSLSPSSLGMSELRRCRAHEQPPLQKPRQHEQPASDSALERPVRCEASTHQMNLHVHRGLACVVPVLVTCSVLVTCVLELSKHRLRINLEVLNSFDLIITTSMMQSVDESVSVSVCVNSQCQGVVSDIPRAQ